MNTKKLRLLLFATVPTLLLAACSPEVGSDKWCVDMKAKPKGEWTANEAGDYAKYCILELEKAPADSAN